MKLVLWVEPVPASRPRVSRKGFAYYSKSYNKFRQAATTALGAVKKPKGCPVAGPIAVVVHFYCKRPKNPSNPYPIGDIDNHLKSILDALNEWAWHDDVQIVTIEATKRYSDSPRIEVEWKECQIEPERVRVRPT
jgi:Holliday junction resolvase RusA-like endonuclease